MFTLKFVAVQSDHFGVVSVRMLRFRRDKDAPGSGLFHTAGPSFPAGDRAALGAGGTGDNFSAIETPTIPRSSKC